MNKFEVNYRFSPGDPVWFFHDNKVSKGIIDNVEIRLNTPGLRSRGYNDTVKSLFRKLRSASKEEKELTGFVKYSVDLLYHNEEFCSSPHFFIESDNKLFNSKEELLKSL